MTSKCVDEWMEQIMEQVHGSPVAAQDMVMVDEGGGKIMTKTEVQVHRSKSAVWTRMSFRLDLERAYQSLIDEVGTDAKIYALFCIGVTPSELAAEAHLKWPDAPKNEYEVNKAILRGRGEWDMRLRKIGIYASQKGGTETWN